MFKKMWSLIVNFPRGNILIICVVLGLISASTISVFGQDRGYTVGPGDVLYISVWGDEKISGQVTVGPDGTIMLPQPVGAVYVNHMTADEITELLTREMGKYLRQPVVSVSIRSFQGFVIHVLGQVKLPSFYQIPEGTSLQEAITQAGGFTELADRSSIVLYRKNDESVEKREIDFLQFLEQNDMENNPVLKTDDVVVVPGITTNERLNQLVTVFGEVANPGTYNLDEPMSIMDVLMLAGGSLRSASLRDVVIYSRSVEGKDAYRYVDIEAMFTETGDSAPAMPIVSPGEALFVPNISLDEKLSFPVNVAGQVVKQGSYQVIDGMRLMDAIFLAGGFAAEASIDNIVLIREEQNSSTVFSLSLRSYLTEGDMEVNPVLHERDTIVVPMIETSRGVSPVQMAFSASVSVSVIGEVGKPGVYQIPTESNLLDAITQAGGPTGNADLERVMVIRGEKSEMGQRLLVDLEEVVVEGKFELLPAMFSGDIVLIPKEREKRDWWKTFIGAARDVTVILSLFWYFTRIRS